MLCSNAGKLTTPTMAYCTIPEEPSANDALLAKPKPNIKRLAGGAAVASCGKACGTCE